MPRAEKGSTQRMLEVFLGAALSAAASGRSFDGLPVVTDRQESAPETTRVVVDWTDRKDRSAAPAAAQSSRFSVNPGTPIVVKVMAVNQFSHSVSIAGKTKQHEGTAFLGRLLEPFRMAGIPAARIGAGADRGGQFRRWIEATQLAHYSAHEAVEALTKATSPSLSEKALDCLTGFVAESCPMALTVVQARGHRFGSLAIGLLGEESSCNPLTSRLPSACEGTVHQGLPRRSSLLNPDVILGAAEVPKEMGAVSSWRRAGERTLGYAEPN